MLSIIICYLLLTRDSGKAQIKKSGPAAGRPHIRLIKRLLQRLPAEELVNSLVVSEFIHFCIFLNCFFIVFFLLAQNDSCAPLPAERLHRPSSHSRGKGFFAHVRFPPTRIC